MSKELRDRLNNTYVVNLSEEMGEEIVDLYHAAGFYTSGF